MFFIETTNSTFNEEQILIRHDVLVSRFIKYIRKWNLHYSPEELLDEFLCEMRTKFYTPCGDIPYEGYLYARVRYFMLGKRREEYRKNSKEWAITSMSKSGDKLPGFTVDENTMQDDKALRSYDDVLAVLDEPKLIRQFDEWTEILGEKFIRYFGIKAHAYDTGCRISDKEISEDYGISMAVIADGKAQLREYSVTFLEYVQSIQALGCTFTEFVDARLKEEKISLVDLNL